MAGLSAGLRAVQVSASAEYSLVLTECGAVFSWGKGRVGQLGHGSRDGTKSPKQIMGLDVAGGRVTRTQSSQGRVTEVSAGPLHALAVNAQGEIYAWGDNSTGQCAQLTSQHSRLFVPFKIFAQVIKQEGVRQIDCGENFSGFLTRTDIAYVWGGN